MFLKMGGVVHFRKGLGCVKRNTRGPHQTGADAHRPKSPSDTSHHGGEDGRGKQRSNEECACLE